MGQVEEGLAILQLVAEVRRHQGGYRGQFPDALAKDAYFRSAPGGVVDHDFTFAAEAHDPAEEAPVIEHDRIVLVMFRDGLVWLENGFNDVFRCCCGTRGREIRPDSRS